MLSGKMQNLSNVVRSFAAAAHMNSVFMDFIADQVVARIQEVDSRSLGNIV